MNSFSTPVTRGRDKSFQKTCDHNRLGIGTPVEILRFRFPLSRLERWILDFMSTLSNSILKALFSDVIKLFLHLTGKASLTT